MQAQDDTAITADGQVHLKSAKSSASQVAVQAGVTVSASSSEEKGDAQGGSAAASIRGGASSSQQGVNIQSGGRTSRGPRN